MKTNKLNLNKEIIANLSVPESSQAKGGTVYTAPCPTHVTVYTCPINCGWTNDGGCTADPYFCGITASCICAYPTDECNTFQTECCGETYNDCTGWCK